MDAVSKGIYEKSMQRHAWTVDEVLAKWASNKEVNRMWAQAMLSNLLGNEEEAEKVAPEVFAR